MIKALKPLVANLERLEYGHYLMSKDYSIILLENDLDELWSAAINIANDGEDTIYIGNSIVYEAAFLQCIELLWTSNKTKFYEFINVTIEGLIQKNESKNFSRLFISLNNIGMDTKTLSELQEHLKTEISKSHPTQSINKKIFISHSSRDKFYGDKFVDFLKRIGINDDDIIFTSNPAYGIPVGQNVFDWLKLQISEKPFVIYLLSDDYYKSIACLNEMGAAWIVENKQVAIFTPGFDLSSKEFQSGALNPRKIGFYINDEDRLHTFIELLSEEFEIKKKPLLLSQSIKTLVHEIGEENASIAPANINKKSNNGKIENVVHETTSLPTRTSHTQANPTNSILFDKFLNVAAENKFKDDELILLHYIIDTGRYKLGTGWQEPHEVEHIIEWEKINEIKGLLSKNYSSVLKRFDLRGYTVVSEVTSHGNPKELKIKDEISNNLFDLPQSILDLIWNAVERNHQEYTEEENQPDDLPF